MLATMLVLGFFNLLLGEETFRLTRRKWKKFTTEADTKAPKYPQDLHFYRRLYRRRIQIAASLFLLGGLFPLTGYFVTQNLSYESVFCLLMCLLLLGWVCLLGLIEGIASYIHFSRRNADEIIEEEKKFLREHLSRLHSREKSENEE